MVKLYTKAILQMATEPIREAEVTSMSDGALSQDDVDKMIRGEIDLNAVSKKVDGISKDDINLLFNAINAYDEKKSKDFSLDNRQLKFSSEQLDPLIESVISKPTGEKLIFEDGSVDEGDFVDGKFHGKGKITYADGRVDEGDYSNDKKNGQGKMTYPDGKVEEGEWKDGEFVQFVGK
jgi:antitoxin component YwqK of YwqJK toxin-antitoxin module